MSGERIGICVGRLDCVDTRRADQACFATLSLAEKQRAESFAFERHRRQYVFAHRLLGLVLPAVVPQIASSDWCFVTDGYGRPLIAAATIARMVYFSLSHTEVCVARAVSAWEAVGIDVDQIHGRRALLTVARSNFSPEETDALRKLPPGDLVDRFFDYWTLKAAYPNARGVSLNLPLNQFSILISAGRHIGIGFLLA